MRLVKWASRFQNLPFDHLMFTGSGATGRKVMAAAAPKLDASDFGAGW